MSLERRIDGIEAMIRDSSGTPASPVPAFTRPTLKGAPRRPNLGLALPSAPQMPRNETENRLRDIMKASGIIKIDGVDYRTEMKDLQELEELGDGTSGHVVKMLHMPSGSVIAVKQMRRTGNTEENKRIVNDIETALKAHGCPYIVQCLGFIITSADVWICMELMATCFDKLLKRTARPVPEEILGKVTVSVVKALSFLKDKDTMHRDVKPSNILVDERGVIKLCDFGISGQLNNSKAKTRSAGCVAYLAPERIDPNRLEYDIRADVWSLGITLVECATGKFPYQDCRTDFEVLTRVMQSAPPTLPADQGFSLEFQNFVKRCLIHDVNSRPKYKDLLLLPFLKSYEANQVNVAGWLKGAMKLAGFPAHQQRDQSLPEQRQPEPQPDTDNDQEIEMCSPMPLVKSPQASLYASSSNNVHSHVPERSAFPLSPPKAIPRLSLSPEKPLLLHLNHQQQQQQYCDFRINALEGPTIASVASPPQPQPPPIPIRSHLVIAGSYEPPPPVPPVVPEPSKSYRKSPFLPRKKNSPESNNSAPKKESKLSTFGSSILKNFTTSPFSQRKQQQPVQQQPPVVPQSELPPTTMIIDKQRPTAHYPSSHHQQQQNQPQTLYHHHQNQIHPHHHRPGETTQIPKYMFHNSPLLQRRNPSYITYGEQCSGSPGKGRTSANTSPIVLQRFFHQQKKIADERQLANENNNQNNHQSGDCADTSNPFLGSGGGNGGSLSYSPQARQKYQTIRSRQHNPLLEPKNDFPGGEFKANGASGGERDQGTVSCFGLGGNSPAASGDLYSGNCKGTVSNASPMPSYVTTLTTTTTTTTTTHQRLNLRTMRPYEDESGDTAEKRQEENVHRTEFAQEISVSDSASANHETINNNNNNSNSGKEQNYEKNLGDVKRRFASYLKVNLSEERRLRTEEFNSRQSRTGGGGGQSQGTQSSSFASTNPFLDASDSYLAPEQNQEQVDKFKLDRRHRSPDPPPRYNRQSPLLLRKKLEMTNWGGSPLLSRRLITGSPPIPTPRRDCESVPGSPQFRTRIHYTPEPQRRFYRP